jgi:hypothetical protein
MFTNTSLVCSRCQQATESVEHALIECQEVYAFWSKLYQVLKFSQYSRPNTYSTLSSYISRNRRGQLNAIARGLWVIHCTSLSFFPNTLIINTDAPFRVEVVGERHTDSKTAYRHGTQYPIAVQQCMKVFAGYHRFIRIGLIIIMFSYD